MALPTFQEWKKINIGKGINEYYEEFPEAKVSPNNQPIIIQKVQSKEAGENFNFSLWIIAAIIIIGGAYFGIQKYSVNQQKKAEYHVPQKYLVLYNTKGNITLLGQSVIKGTIENKSTHSTYVNITLAVDFFDKNSNYIKSEEIPLGKRMTPFDREDFKLKTNFPWKAKSYNVKLVSADVIKQVEN